MLCVETVAVNCESQLEFDRLTCYIHHLGPINVKIPFSGCMLPLTSVGLLALWSWKMRPKHDAVLCGVISRQMCKIQSWHNQKSPGISIVSQHLCGKKGFFTAKKLISKHPRLFKLYFKSCKGFMTKLVSSLWNWRSFETFVLLLDWLFKLC